MQKAKIVGLLSTAAVAGGGMYLYHLKETGDKLETTTKISYDRIDLQRVYLTLNVRLVNRGTVTLKLSDMDVDVQSQNLRGQRDSLLTNIGQQPTVVASPNQPVEFSFSLATLPIQHLIQVFGKQNINRLRSGGLDVESVVTTKLFGFYPVEKRDKTILRADLKTLMSFL